MSSKHQQYASRVLAAFTQAGHYTDQEIVAAGGPSTTTLTKIRKVAAGGAAMPEPRGDVHRKIDTAAGWVPGSSRRLWHRGEEPSRLRADWREIIMSSPVLDDAAKRDLIAQLARSEGDEPPDSGHPSTESRANL